MATVTEGEDQGANFLAAMNQQMRQQASYNALNKMYGPGIAGDPQAAADAAKAALLNQTEQSTADLTNETNTQQGAGQQALIGQYGAQAGAPKELESDVQAQSAQQALNYKQGFVAAGQLADAADPNTGAIPGDVFDKTIGAHPTQYGLDPAMVNALKAKVTAPGGVDTVKSIQQRLGSAVGLGVPYGAMQFGTNANGQSVAIVNHKDGTVSQIPLAGTTPVSVQNAKTSAEKIPIAQQNANTNAFRAATTANNSVYGNPNGAAPAGAGGGKAAAPAATSDGTPALPPAIAALPPKGRSQVLGQASQLANMATNLGTTNTIIDTAMKQISPYTSGVGSLLKDLPGSAQTDLKANLATLKSQGLMSWIASMKNAQGQTGIGRVLQSEANAAQSLFGNMEQDQSAKQLAFHMTLFKQTVNNLYKHANDSFKQQWQTDPFTAIGEKPPGTAPADSGPKAPVDFRAYFGAGGK